MSDLLPNVDGAAGATREDWRLWRDVDPLTKSGSARPTTTSDPQGYSGVEEHLTPLQVALEISGTVLFPALFALNLYFSISRLDQLQRYWIVVLGIPIGLVLSDLMTGLVHWAADTYGSPDTPILGPSIVKGFRLHHRYPRDITTHNLVTTIGDSCMLAVPVLLLCLGLLWLMPDSNWLALIVTWLVLACGASIGANQFHKWAHQEKPSAITRCLQRTRLVLKPSHHERHHTEPYNMHYCITNGWLNPILNKIRFFRTLEAALRLLGIETQRGRVPPQPGEVHH